MSLPLEVYLFGSCEVRVEGNPIGKLRTRKCFHLLELLILRYGRPVDRDFLAAALWPESGPVQAGYNLRQILVSLRKALGGQAYRLEAPTPRTLRLDLNEAFVDVIAFDAAVQSTEREMLEGAVLLYRGPLLEEDTEDWITPEREARQEAYLRTLETLADQDIAAAEPRVACQRLRAIIAADPWREEVHRKLIRLLAALGEDAAANQVYRDLRLFLRSEINAEPAPETQALFQEIRSFRSQREATTTAGRKEQGRSPLDTAPDVSGAESVEPPPSSRPTGHRLEPVGGAMPLNSPYYISRPADTEFLEALTGGEGIVLVKGARQMGKTSLLARGLHTLREQRHRIALTDCRAFTPNQLKTQESLSSALAQTLAMQLNIDTPSASDWDPELGANLNLENFVRRRALQPFEETLVWGLDEVDALFGYDYTSNVFGLFRSWYNRRALEPHGPWNRLILVLVYATEAHLFITNQNQSPFNIGARIALADFTREQIAEMNRRHGEPLRDDSERERFYTLLNGHPYLSRLGLAAMARGMTLETLEAEGDRDEGLFGPHLRQMLSALHQDSVLTAAVRDVLNRLPCQSPVHFYRLRSAGILSGESALLPQVRCRIYRTYLERQLA